VKISFTEPLPEIQEKTTICGLLPHMA